MILEETVKLTETQMQEWPSPELMRIEEWMEKLENEVRDLRSGRPRTPEGTSAGNAKKLPPSTTKPESAALTLKRNPPSNPLLPQSHQISRFFTSRAFSSTN